MFSKYKSWIKYIVIITIIYNIFPYYATVTNDKGMFISSLILINPLSCLIISLIFCLKNKQVALFNLIIALLFIIPINIFYNYTANIYILINYVFSNLGTLIAYLILKIKKNKHRF